MCARSRKRSEFLTVEGFALELAAGTLNEDWPTRSLKTQQVMDACLESALNGGRAVTL